MVPHDESPEAEASAGLSKEAADAIAYARRHGEWPAPLSQAAAVELVRSPEARALEQAWTHQPRAHAIRLWMSGYDAAGAADGSREEPWQD